MKAYPGIKVVKQTFTNWSFAPGGKQMLDILNSGVQVDGVWTSGIDYTVVNAFKTAGKPYVPVVGADNNEFLKQLINLNPGFAGAAVTNPATIGGVGAAIAIKVLERQHRQEVDEADARGVGHGERREDDQGVLLAEASADLQLAAVHQAVHDVHGGRSSSAARGRKRKSEARGGCRAASSPPRRRMSLLTAREVSKRYGPVVALGSATLVVEPGEVHALLGANGAGKSTLVKVLTGVIRPDAGEIRVDGAAVRVSSPAQAARIGLAPVFQDPALVPDLTRRAEHAAHRHAGRRGAAASATTSTSTSTSASRRSTCRCRCCACSTSRARSHATRSC